MPAVCDACRCVRLRPLATGASRNRRAPARWITGARDSGWPTANDCATERWPSRRLHDRSNGQIGKQLNVC